MENHQKHAARGVKRPFILTFLCLIGFTYTALFSLFFLSGIIYSSGFSGVLDKYLQIYDLSRLNFFFFALAGFAIFFTSFTGVYLMWKMHWAGYYIYTLSALTFISLEMVFAGFYLPDFVIHITFIFLFLIAMTLAARKKKRAARKATEETPEGA